jgi:hypothetical protein
MDMNTAWVWIQLVAVLVLAGSVVIRTRQSRKTTVKV